MGDCLKLNEPREKGGVQMSYDRADHLADLNRDIQNWQAEVKRLELEGHTSKADAVRGWIKSAMRLAEVLRNTPHT